VILRLCHFLLAALAECLSYLTFADGFVAGAMRAAYERGYARGYETEATQQAIVLDDED